MFTIPQLRSYTVLIVSGASNKDPVVCSCTPLPLGHVRMQKSKYDSIQVSGAGVPQATPENTTPAGQVFRVKLP